MQRLELELLGRFERHEPHARSTRGFGSRLGVVEIVLVRLHVRLHILGRHQAYFVAGLGEEAAPVLRTRTGLHRHHRPRRRRREGAQLRPVHLLPEDHGAVPIQAGILACLPGDPPDVGKRRTEEVQIALEVRLLARRPLS